MDGRDAADLGEDDRVRLNVCGQAFETTRGTLLGRSVVPSMSEQPPPPTYFAGLLAGCFGRTERAKTTDCNNVAATTYFIDRCATTFEYVLLHLQGYRVCAADVPTDLLSALVQDADFYGLPDLYAALTIVEEPEHCDWQRENDAILLDGEKLEPLLELIDATGCGARPPRQSPLYRNMWWFASPWRDSSSYILMPPLRATVRLVQPPEALLSQSLIVCWDIASNPRSTAFACLLQVLYARLLACSELQTGLLELFNRERPANRHVLGSDGLESRLIQILKQGQSGPDRDRYVSLRLRGDRLADVVLLNERDEKLKRPDTLALLAKQSHVRLELALRPGSIWLSREVRLWGIRWLVAFIRFRGARFQEPSLTIKRKRSVFEE